MSEQITKISLLMLGDRGVGKSSILRSFAQLPTSIVGGNRVSRFIDIEDRRCELEVWNAPELRRLGHIPPAYYRNMDGVILVYDVTDGDFPHKIKNWMELLTQCEVGLPIALLGNKIDKKNTEITRGEEVAEEYGSFFCETSAKNPASVLTSFAKIASRICSDSRVYGSQLSFDTVRLTDPVAKSKAKCRCW